LLDRLEGVIDYMQGDHDLDKVIDALSKVVNKYGKYIEKLDKEVAILRKDSHPPVFNIDDYKDLLKRIKTLEKNCKCKGK
tara:strand:+ start:8050 stop:8289 length:240 start_codon:yes stop_codon:yes gene_type:complete